MHDASLRLSNGWRRAPLTLSNGWRRVPLTLSNGWRRAPLTLSNGRRRTPQAVIGLRRAVGECFGLWTASGRNCFFNASCIRAGCILLKSTKFKFRRVLFHNCVAVEANYVSLHRVCWTRFCSCNVRSSSSFSAFYKRHFASFLASISKRYFLCHPIFRSITLRHNSSYPFEFVFVPRWKIAR